MITIPKLKERNGYPPRAPPKNTKRSRRGINGGVKEIKKPPVEALSYDERVQIILDEFNDICVQLKKEKYDNRRFESSGPRRSYERVTYLTKHCVDTEDLLLGKKAVAGRSYIFDGECPDPDVQSTEHLGNVNSPRGQASGLPASTTRFVHFVVFRNVDADTHKTCLTSCLFN